MRGRALLLLAFAPLLACGGNGMTVTAGCGTFGLATGATTGAASGVPHGSFDPDYCPEAGTNVPDAGVDAPVVAVDAARLTDAGLAACYASCDSMCVGDSTCITSCEASCRG